MTHSSPFFTPPYPTVRLSPKAEARAIRHGFPWVYAGELVLDRRTKADPAFTYEIIIVTSGTFGQHANIVGRVRERSTAVEDVCECTAICVNGK